MFSRFDRILACVGVQTNRQYTPSRGKTFWVRQLTAHSALRSIISRKSSVLPCDAMHSAIYSVAGCLSVCLSHAGILLKLWQSAMWATQRVLA